MPTYDYACKKCEEVFEVFHAMSATPDIECEKCQSREVERMIGTGAGIIFKGSGFYQTDYKNSTAPEKKETKKETCSPSKPETKKCSPSGCDN